MSRPRPRSWRTRLRTARTRRLSRRLFDLFFRLQNRGAKAAVALSRNFRKSLGTSSALAAPQSCRAPGLVGTRRRLRVRVRNRIRHEHTPVRLLQGSFGRRRVGTRGPGSDRSAVESHRRASAEKKTDTQDGETKRRQDARRYYRPAKRGCGGDA